MSSHSPPFPNRSAVGCAGFSLVEVALALAVLAFAFIGIFALLPAGITSFRRAMDASVCAQIAQRVIGDAQQTDFDVLTDAADLPGTANFTFRAPKVGAAVLRYFDDQGSEIVPKNPAALSPEESAKILYVVNMRVTPQTSLPKTNTGADAPNVATLTVQVASSPGNRAIPISTADPSDAARSDRNLFTSVPGVTILTYSAHVGRNE